MTSQILPPTVSEIATGIADEANNLKMAIGLMERSLQFNCSDKEAAMRAQGELFFLTSSIGDLQIRLELLSDDARALARTEKVAA